jgi:adenylate kinase family enzyme
LEFRELALAAEHDYVKACSAATESEKPLCKYGPMCHRLGNPEWRSHHAHKYKHPGVALKVFVLGPPQCGKTQLCSLLETKTQPRTSLPWLKAEVWHLSKILLRFPHLVNQVFDSAEVSSASPGISDVSSSKSLCFSDDKVNGLAGCVVRSLLSSEDKNSGWILDNFPRSVGQLKVMAEAGVLPHCVVNIEVPMQEDPSSHEMILHRERLEVLVELRRCGVTVITVASRDTRATDQPHPESLLPLKRTASGSCSPAVTASETVNSVFDQACAEIESFLHSEAISPYTTSFPKRKEKRYNPLQYSNSMCFLAADFMNFTAFSDTNTTTGLMRRGRCTTQLTLWLAMQFCRRRLSKAQEDPLGMVCESLCTVCDAVVVVAARFSSCILPGTVSEKNHRRVNFSVADHICPRSSSSRHELVT